MIPNALIYIPKEALSFAKEYSIIIKRVSIEFISFVYLGTEYHVKYTDKSEIIHWLIKAVKESSVVAFNNCNNLHAIDLGQMTDIMNNEVRDVAKEEFLQWLHKFGKAGKKDVGGSHGYRVIEPDLNNWKVGWVEVELNVHGVIVRSEVDNGAYTYTDYEQAIEKIIEISQKLDKSSLFHRIFQ